MITEEEKLHLISHLHEAAYHLQDHGVVAFPTETVMGLGVAYDDEIAYNRLNKIKRRPEDKPYSLMVQEPEQIEMFAVVDERSKKIIDAFLPGPLTMLMPVKNDVPFWVTHGGPTIGIRVSSHFITEELLSFVGRPLLVPSANRSGEKPAMTSEEVKQIFGDELDYIVEGHAENGVPSTIIDVTGPEIKIIRKGSITLEMINEVIK